MYTSAGILFVAKLLREKLLQLRSSITIDCTIAILQISGYTLARS